MKKKLYEHPLCSLVESELCDDFLAASGGNQNGDEQNEDYILFTKHHSPIFDDATEDDADDNDSSLPDSWI